MEYSSSARSGDDEQGSSGLDAAHSPESAGGSQSTTQRSVEEESPASPSTPSREAGRVVRPNSSGAGASWAAVQSQKLKALVANQVASRRRKQLGAAAGEQQQQTGTANADPKGGTYIVPVDIGNLRMPRTAKAGSNQRGHNSARRNSASANGSLLRLFESEGFDSHLHMYYLYHRPESGVEGYLVNLLYNRAPADVSFYLPQLWSVLVVLVFTHARTHAPSYVRD
eukprot:GHVU01226213.1.p1 GENE.GHVU01226213.1~~GHVU01226213.1.p1  ORF type:complete len:226 (+),score=24.95 GHVU01226213.1:540-1217(+)